MKHKKLIFIWLAGGLVVLPFVWWPQAEVVFEIPRVVAFQWWVIGLAILGIWNWKQKIHPKILWGLLMWVAILLLSSIPSWSESWMGNYYRHDGLLTQILLVVMAICVGWSRVSKDKLLLIQTSISTLVGLLVVMSCLWPGLQIFLPQAFWWLDGTVGLTFGNPHLLAGYLSVSLAGLVGLRSGMKRKYGWMATIAMGIHLLAIAATEAYLIMGLAVVILSWRWGFDNKKRIIPLGLTVLAVVIFLGWVFRPVNTFDAESRSRIWHRAILAWEQRPVLGWGWAQFPKAIEKVVWPYPVLSDVYVDKAHSSAVEVLVTTGLLGLIIYGSIWKESLKHSTNRGWLLMTIAYLVMSQLNVVSISTEMLGWMGVGLAMANEEPD